MQPEIKATFDRIEPQNRKVLLKLRELVFETAAEHPEIGQLTETLKWGEPSYLPKTRNIGSTLRLWQTREDNRPAMFVNCKTNLIHQFKEFYPSVFDYRDDRAVILKSAIAETVQPLKHCMALTLTYHLHKKQA